MFKIKKIYSYLDCGFGAYVWWICMFEGEDHLLHIGHLTAHALVHRLQTEWASGRAPAWLRRQRKCFRTKRSYREEAWLRLPLLQPLIRSERTVNFSTVSALQLMWILDAQIKFIILTVLFKISCFIFRYLLAVSTKNCTQNATRYKY